MNPRQLDLVDLTDDIFLQHMPFDSETVRQLNLTCTRFSLFGNDRDIRKTYKLLQQTIYADYDAAEKMVAENPSLMFQHVNFMHPDGISEYISPLKYTFKVYDTYMWKMFLGKIQNNSEHVELFLKQAREQTEHINLEPLFEAYKEFEVQYNLWERWFVAQYNPSKRCKISNEDIDKAWLKLSAKQRELLPWNFLKEFCRKMKSNSEEGNSWDPQSTFDVNVLPRPRSCQVYNYQTGSYMFLLPSTLHSGPDFGFTLTRCRTIAYKTNKGEGQVNVALHRFSDVRTQRGGGGEHKFDDLVDVWMDDRLRSVPDSATFQRLYKVRAADLDKQIRAILWKYFKENIREIRRRFIHVYFDEEELRRKIFDNVENFIMGKFDADQLYLEEKSNGKMLDNAVNFLIERFDAYQKEDQVKRAPLFHELQNQQNNIQAGSYLGNNGFLAKQKKREECAEAAENRIKKP